MTRTNRNVNRIAAILIAVIVLLTAASGGVWFYLNHTGASAGNIAEIYQDGELIETIRLDTVTESYTIDIDNASGGTNVIEVRHNEIGIIDANCPDKLCVNMGFIHSSAMPITCLPNKLVIRIISEDNEEEPDAVVY